MRGLIGAAAGADRDYIGQQARKELARRWAFEFDHTVDGGKRGQDFGALGKRSDRTRGNFPGRPVAGRQPRAGGCVALNRDDEDISE